MTEERFRIVVVVLWLITIATIYNTGRYGIAYRGEAHTPTIIDTRTGTCYERSNPSYKHSQNGEINRHYYEIHAYNLSNEPQDAWVKQP